MTIPEMDIAGLPVSVIDNREDVYFIAMALVARSLLSDYGINAYSINSGEQFDFYKISNLCSRLSWSEPFPHHVAGYNFYYINKRFTPPSEPRKLPATIAEMNYRLNYIPDIWSDAALPGPYSPLNPSNGLPMSADIFRRMYLDIRERSLVYAYSFDRPTTSGAYGGRYGRTTTTYSYSEEEYSPSQDAILSSITGSGGGAIKVQGSTDTDETFAITYSAPGSGLSWWYPSTGELETLYRVGTYELGRRMYNRKTVQTQSYIDFNLQQYLSSVTAIVPVEVRVGLGNDFRNEGWVFAIPLTAQTNDMFPNFASKWRMTVPFTESYMRSFLASREAVFPASTREGSLLQDSYFRVRYDGVRFIINRNYYYNVPDAWSWTPPT